MDIIHSPFILPVLDMAGFPGRIQASKKTLSQKFAGTGMIIISAVPPGLTQSASTYYRTNIRYPLITEGTPSYLQGENPFGLPSEAHSYVSAHRFPPAAALCVAGNELLLFLIGLGNYSKE